MYAHGIEIFNRANHDHVVAQVAHQFQFVFFPPKHRFFDQGFMNGRKVESAREHFHELFAVVGHTSARTAQREAGTNNYRKSDFPGELQAIFQIVDQRRLRHIEADALHGIFEIQPVFRLLDGIDIRADQPDVVLVENPAVRKFDRQIERGLSAHCWKNGKAGTRRHLALHPNDLFQVLAAERLNVSAVGRLGIGHDGRRIRVGEHHLEALRLKRLAGLRAGVIEFSGLANDDWARADDEDLRDVSAFGHQLCF